MFKMYFKKENNDEGFNFDGIDNFECFKPDLDLRGLRLQTEAKLENRLFYEIQNN